MEKASESARNERRPTEPPTAPANVATLCDFELCVDVVGVDLGTRTVYMTSKTSNTLQRAARRVRGGEEGREEVNRSWAVGGSYEEGNNRSGHEPR